MYENLKKLNTKLVYCTVTEEQIKGYSNACELAHLSGTSDLPRQLQRAIRDQYTVSVIYLICFQYKYGTSSCISIFIF